MKITATGTSELSLPAECALVSLHVAKQGPDRRTVVEGTGSVAEQVREVLAGSIADGGGRELRLSSLRTWTDIPTDHRGRRTEARYGAEIRGSVIIDDLTRLADLLIALAALDGVEVGQIGWNLKEETLVRMEPAALREAFGAAQRRAKWIAEAAGLSSVSAVSVQDDRGSRSFTGAIFKAASFGEASAPLRLDPEDVDVSASLTVEFEAL